MISISSSATVLDITVCKETFMKLLKTRLNKQDGYNSGSIALCETGRPEQGWHVLVETGLESCFFQLKELSELAISMIQIQESYCVALGYYIF